MKTKKYALLITLMSVIGIGANAQIYQQYFYEGFESGNLNRTVWEESATPSSAKWIYQNGGYDGDPQKAAVGTKNALFYYETENYQSRLSAPKQPINLVGVSKPVLSFYMALIGDGESLEVSYRVSTTSEWITLRTYNVECWNWTKREIILPDEAKVSTLQLSFLATTSGMGSGVCLDEIILEDRTESQRMLNANTIELWQVESNLASGSKSNPVAGIRLAVEGNSGTLDLNSFKFNYTGTSIDDIEKFSLFYTIDSAYNVEPSNKLAECSTFDGNTINFDINNTQLETGKNFLWLAADIKNGVSHGNIFDIEIPINGITVTPGGNAALNYPTSIKTTAGSSKIEESLILYGFEESNAASEWSMQGAFQIGVPTGIGNGDPSYAFAGEKVLATNLSGNFPRTATPNFALSPTANAKYYKDVNLHFSRLYNITLLDKIIISLNNKDTLWQNYTQSRDFIWRTHFQTITSATRNEDVRVRISLTPSTGETTMLGGLNIDNFAVTGDYIAQDAGIDSILPVERCGLTLNQTTFKVWVKNYGGENISTNFQVGYSLDNGRTFTKKDFTTDLLTERDNNDPNTAYTEFSFDPVLLTTGLKQLVFKTFMEGDEDESNDSQSSLLYVFPTVSDNYAESFERNNGYWYATGTKSSWAYGTPAGTTLNAASDGAKAWATKLNGNYNNSEISNIESPCFDLTNIPYPVLSFDYNMVVADDKDKLKVEYSTNSGETWGELPASTKYQQNWSATGWNSTTSGFVTAYTLLPEADFGKNGVKFRFLFTSDTAGVAEGVVIDNIKLQPLPYDVSLTADNFLPTDACEIGNTKISFNFKNIGNRTIVSGTKLPFTVKIDNNNEINDTITIDSDLIKNGAKLLTTNKEYRIATSGVHKVVIASQLSPNFGISSDDTLKRDVTVTGMPFYSLGADIGTTDISSIDLDAGEFSAGVDYSSYAWQFSDDDMNTWNGAGDTRIIELSNDSQYGYWAVTVQNAVGCTATDTIKVINSNQDVRVSAILNISSSCLHPDLIIPQVTLSHNAGNNFDGSVGFEVALSINGTEVLTETHTPADGWAPSNTTTFTFTGSIDLSNYEEYDIRAYTKFANDVDKTNDTTKISVSTYGPPSLTFNYADTILTTEANMLTFSASCPTDVTYLWKRYVDFSSDWVDLSETSNTLRPPDKKSALYKVVLTDNTGHGCGTSSDSVYINTKDIGVQSITMPGDTVCYFDEGINIIAQIKNYGADVYPIGTEFTASAQTSISYQEQTITLQSELEAGGTVEVTFPQKVQVMLGDMDINAVVEAENDVNSLNDSYTRSTHSIPQPTVSISPDTLLFAFTSSTTYEIIPTYSDDCRTFIWDNSAYPNISDEPTFTITGFPEDKYFVTASNGFCTATDSIIIRSEDVAITEIVSPIDTCASSSTSYPVKVRIKNMGTPIPAGSSLQISGTSTATNILFMPETPINLSKIVTFNREWASQKDTVITLEPSINLANKKSIKVSLTITPINFEDVIISNNSMEKTALMLSYPSIQFVPDNSNNRDVLTETDTLMVSTRYFSYQWEDADASSDDSTYIAQTSGTYDLTVTDFLGCSSSRSVNLTFYVNDLSLESLVSPSSACTQTNAEVVTIRVKNTGTYTLPEGTTLEIGYKLGTNEPYTQVDTLTSPLAPEATIDLSFDQTIDLTTSDRVYSIQTWVNTKHDRVSSNNTTTTNVSHYAPVIISGFNDVETCYNQPITLAVSGQLGSTPSYLWSTDEMTSTISTSQAGNYWVRVTNENGCVASDTLHLTVHNLPIVDIATDTAICNGASLTLDAQNTGSSFLWNTDTDNTNQTISVTLAGKYKVVVTDINGCSNSDSTTVSINELPEISLGDDIEFCAGQSEILDAGAGAASYLWSTNETTQTIEVTSGQEYWARYTDGNGCSKTDYITVTVNPLPTVNLGSNITICEGDTAALSATTNGTSYLWSNNQSTSTIDVTANGAYWLTVIDNKGCQNSDTVLLSYYAPVIINLGADTTICENTAITLSANTGTYSYLWNTNETSRTITTTQEGTYSVTITDLNNCSYSDEIAIDFYQIPEIDLGADIMICQRDTATIISNLVNMDYLWSTGETTQSIKTPNEGSYWVAVTDANNCSNSDTVLVSFYTPFSVNLGADNAFCANETFVIDAGNAGFSHAWNTGETSQSIEVNNAGLYSVVVTDTYGCTNTDSITLSTNAIPQVYIGADTAICNGASLGLDAGTDGISYLWSNNATTQTVNLTNAGAYWVRITNANGCSNYDTLNLSINELPVISLGNDTTICQMIPITLDAGTNGGNTVEYLWNDGQTSQTISTNLAGTYTATITDANGCSKSDAIEITVHEPFTVDLGSNISYCIDTIHTLDAGNTGFNYIWSTGQTSQTIVVSESNYYSVIVTDSYNCPQYDTINVLFNTPPPLELGNDYSICYGTSTILDADTYGTSYEWSTGETTQTITVDSEGLYSVTIYDPRGCTNHDSIYITVNDLPAFSIGDDTEICEYIPYTLNANILAASYIWSNNATTQSTNVTMAGQYWVEVTDNNGCTNSDTILLTAKAKPELNLGNDVEVCTGSEYELDAGATAVSYLWSDGSTQQTLTITVENTSTYWAQVTGNNGCINIDTINIDALTLPEVSHNAIDAICSNGSPIALTGGQPNNGTYSGAGVTNSTFDPTVTGAGIQQVVYQITGENGCTNSEIVNITVNAAPNVNLGADCYVNADTTLNAGGGFTSYLWNNGSTNQTITVSNDGEYSVIVTDANGCSNSDTIVVSFTKLIDLYISELISPSSECSADQNYPVEMVITNRGRQTFNANEQVTINVKSDNGSFSAQNVQLPNQLAQNQNCNITLSNNIELSAGDHTISLFAQYNDTNCDTTQFDATVHQSPTLNFDSDTLIVDLPYEFDPDIDGTYSFEWNNGSTGSTLNITQYGNYWLVITDANGCTASDTISIISTSIGTIASIDAQVIAYPNPASEELNIAIKSDMNYIYTIKVASLNGTIIWQNETPRTNSYVERINVSGFTPGVYFVIVSTQNNSATLKVIVMR